MLELPGGALGTGRAGAPGGSVGMEDIAHFVELVHVQLTDKRLPIVVLEKVVQAFTELDG